MNYLKALVVGVAVPGILLPLLILLAVLAGKPQVLTVSFLHFIPLLWGIWNVLYFAFFKDFLPKHVQGRWLITGAVLGFLFALYGIFVLNIPGILGFPSSLHYLPLIGLPILYAVLWCFVVKPLNDAFGIH